MTLASYLRIRRSLGYPHYKNFALRLQFATPSLLRYLREIEHLAHKEPRAICPLWLEICVSVLLLLEDEDVRIADGLLMTQRIAAKSDEDRVSGTDIPAIVKSIAAAADLPVEDVIEGLAEWGRERSERKEKGENIDA